jgi:hypothetical protein
VDAYWFRWALGISKMRKPFLNQLYYWIKFRTEVLPKVAKLQKESFDRSEDEIEIYIDGYTEAWLDIYEVAKVKAFEILLEGVRLDYEK